MKTLSIKLTLVSNYEISFLTNSEVFIPSAILKLNKPTYEQVYDLLYLYVSKYAKKLSLLFNSEYELIFTTPTNAYIKININNTLTPIIYFELCFPSLLLDLGKPLSNTAVSFRLENRLIS